MKLSDSLAKIEEKLPFGKMLSSTVSDIEGDLTRIRDQFANPSKTGGPPELPSFEPPKLPSFPDIKEKLPSAPEPPKFPGFPRSESERNARHNAKYGGDAPARRFMHGLPEPPELPELPKFGNKNKK